MAKGFSIYQHQTYGTSVGDVDPVLEYSTVV